MVIKYKKLSKLWFLLFFLLGSCNFDLKFKDEGFKNTSINSDVSKKNKVFVDRYNFSKEFIIVKKDTLEILESFIEYKYNRTYSGEINKWNGIQLVLVMNEKIPSGFNSTWGIKAKNKNKLQLTGGTGDRMMHTDLFCLPELSFCYAELDTINLMIVKDIFSSNELVTDTIILCRCSRDNRSEAELIDQREVKANTCVPTGKEHFATTRCSTMKFNKNQVVMN